MAINRQNLIIAGLPNFTAADVVTITAGADAGGTMGKDNLKTQEPWEVARLTSVFPHLSYWEVDLSTALPIEAVALVNHSLIPGDQVRVVGVTSGALPAVRSQTLPPTAIEAISNMAPSDITRIDEHPSAKDGVTIAATLGVTSSIRVSFGTPTSTPAVGSGLQCFLLALDVLNPGTEPSNYARVNAQLWEGGVQRTDLGTKAIAVGTGQTVIFPWNATALQTSDGSAVELRLEFTSGSTAVGRVDAVAWECLYQSDKDAADLDTGWVTMIGAETEASWGNTAVQEVDLPSPLWHELFVATSLRSLRIEFRADGMGLFTNFVTTPPRTPSGVVDVGVLLISPAFEAPFNFAPGATLRSRPVLIGGEDEAITGSKRAVAAFRRRTCELQLPLQAESVAHSLFARLDQAAMGVSAFLLVLEPATTSATISRNSSFWAVVEESQGLIYLEGFDEAGEPLRAMGYSIEEKL